MAQGLFLAPAREESQLCTCHIGKATSNTQAASLMAITYKDHRVGWGRRTES